MAYNPLLKDLAKWSNEEHFYNERYIWWLRFSKLGGMKMTPELLERDIFKTPTVSADIRTGEEIHEVSEFYFSDNLGLQIRKEFEDLEMGIDEKLLTLDKESQRKNLKSLLYTQLEQIFQAVQTLVIPPLYLKVVKDEFRIMVLYFKKYLQINDIQEISGELLAGIDYLKYNYDKEDLANFQLKEFHKDLKNKGIISSSTTFVNLQRAFTNKAPVEKIHWIATNGEFFYFMNVLNEKKDLFKISQVWIAAYQCFVLFNKLGEKYSAKKLRSFKNPTQERRQKINDVISHLEV